MTLGALRKPEQRADILDQLQAVSAVGRTSADAITDGIFPEQASYSVASRLLAITANDTRLGVGQSPASDSERPLLSPPRSRRRRKRRANPRTTPLQPLRPLSPTRNDLISAGLSHAELALTLWDAKMERQQLSRDDLLFLLLREETVRVLESVRLLRLSRVSYEQVMELELTLESMRGEVSEKLVLQSRVGSRRQQTLATVLSRNMWIHRKAFGVWQSGMLADVMVRNCATLPVISQILSPTKATAHTKAHPACRVATTLPSSTGCLGSTHQRAEVLRVEWEERLRCAGSSSSSSPVVKKSQKRLSVGGGSIVTATADYLRANCVQELVHTPDPVSTSSRSFCILRRRFAVEKLTAVVHKHHHKAQARRFQLWREQTLWAQCQERVETFCKLKCALWVMRRARWRLRTLVSQSWMRWKSNTCEQRALEQFAALVTIQSWRRQVIGKRKAASYVVQRVAITIQARWRGFYARKMIVRRRRFARYSLAAAQLQRCYRAFRFRQQIAVYVREMRAARVITRCVRAYVKKRCDFHAWCHRLARYHAAITIQSWGRRQRARIHRKRMRCQQTEAAARVLAKFFRWARFIRRFGSRVRRLLEARTRTAVKLQTAYRAKRARARFYELQDVLEEQRRLEILRVMWENAYASTIQTWWRRRRQREKSKASTC